ncbi:STAS domain-containing protein [Streptomyces sp. NPDC002138]|uniref:STAS domain-containing protein n=1 Tax=Streptomyces sp. NPDC002138 TaxID=3154410 RepID=UPI00331F6AC9
MTCTGPENAGAHEVSHPTVTVDIEPGPQRMTARIHGEIDMDEAPGVRAELIAALEASVTGLDVDLSALIFCDSAGLQVLLDLHHRARRSGKTLVLKTSSQLSRLLDLTQTRHLFTIDDGNGRRPSPHGHPGPADHAGRTAAQPDIRPLDDAVIAYNDEP